MVRLSKVAEWLFLLAMITLAIVGLVSLACCSGCGADAGSPAGGSASDVAATKAVANRLQAIQPTPTDLDASLERFNLIKRAYWVNGQRERAMAVTCPVKNRPLGYVVLFSFGRPVGKFVVDGKISSLQSFLTPDSEYFEIATAGGGDFAKVYYNKWLADIDGTYGENDRGVFFFTPDGKYIEWSGEYLYSDIPFRVEDTVIQYD